MNFTISVPVGTTNHGNPQLLCLPAAWTDIVTFLVTNYFAHAASVLPEPGAGFWRTIALIFAALILPISGIVRAVSAIWRHAAFEIKNPVKRAARSRALAMVMRVPNSGPYQGAVRAARDKPKKTDSEVAAHPPSEVTSIREAEKALTDVTASTGSPIEMLQSDRSSGTCWWEVASGYEPIPKHCSIHGQYWLDGEYYLAFVPDHADLSFACDTIDGANSGSGASAVYHQRPTIPCSYSAIQPLIGLAQAMWATYTIYQARGDQIQRYGYAAFGLTVVPYAFMSLLNGAANLVTPQYATMFIIRTPAMTEAEQRGNAFFKDALDVELFEVSSATLPSPWTPVLKKWLPFLLGMIPLAVTGAMSGFRAGDSTSVQRGFTMAWVIVGIVYGSVILSMKYEPEDHEEDGKEKTNKEVRRSMKQYFMDDAACESSAPDFILIIMTLIFSPPAIGGMVVVALMINQYGTCSQIG